jgi:uncharacterized protein YcbK (DUF882 family)
LTGWLAVVLAAMLVFPLGGTSEAWAKPMRKINWTSTSTTAPYKHMHHKHVHRLHKHRSHRIKMHHHHWSHAGDAHHGGRHPVVSSHGQAHGLSGRLMRLLSQISHHFGRPVQIISGCRSRAHNRQIGGARESYHLRCMAADFRISGVGPGQLLRFSRSLAGRGGVGSYCRESFIHLDVGPVREWHWGCGRGHFHPGRHGHLHRKHRGHHAGAKAHKRWHKRHKR